MKFIVIMSLLLLGGVSSAFTVKTENDPSQSLTYLVREPKKKQEHPPLLLLLHGYGSNEKDLFSFAEQLPDDFLVISAQAPYKLGQNSYAWYSLSFDNGKPIGNDEEAEASRQLLIQFIEDVVEKYDVDKDQVYLMGFSQGSIMSLSVSLTQPELVAGIGVFSGRMLEATKENISRDRALKDLEVFMVHSKNDNVLKYQYALDSKSILEKNGIKTVFTTENVGHSISQNSLKAFNAWLNDRGN